MIDAAYDVETARKLAHPSSVFQAGDAGRLSNVFTLWEEREEREERTS